MKYILVLSLLVFSCKKDLTPVISMPVERYKVINMEEDNLPKLLKSYKKAKNEFIMNFDSGEYYGVYENVNFVGKFDIKKVRSGLANGFNYEVELAYLSKDVSFSSRADEYFSKLVSTTNIYVSPNKLNQPDYMVLKMGNKTQNDNLKLIMAF